MPGPSLKSALVNPNSAAERGRSAINRSSIDTMPSLPLDAGDSGLGLLATDANGRAFLAADDDAVRPKHDRNDIPMPEPVEDEGRKPQKGGGGMSGTVSMSPAHRRAYTPEELHAWADKMMDDMNQQADLGKGQVERRYAGAADRSGYNALTNGAVPTEDDWLDQYMRSQR